MFRHFKSYLLCGLLGLTTLTFASIVAPVVNALRDDKPALTDDQKKKVNAVNDQLRNADQSIELAEGVRRSADSKVTLINDRTSFDEANETALRKLEELADAIRSVTTLSVISSLDSTKTEVEKVKTDLTAARDALPAEAEGLPEEIGVARKKVTEQIARLTKQSKAQDDAKKKLQDALAAVPDKVKALTELFPQRISEIAAIAQDADAAALIPALSSNMATLVEVEAQRRVLRTRWKEVASALAQAGSENADKNKAVVDAIDALDSKVNNDVLKKLQPWFGKLATHAKNQSTHVLEILANLIKDPVMNGPDALKRTSEASGVHDELLGVTEGWTKLNAQLQGVTISGFNLNTTSQAAKELGDADTRLTIDIAVVQDGLTGDASEFIADQVSLYYFTDVERIMRMLNSATSEIGGIKGARERAALERQKLTTTELDLAAALDAVNAAQQRVNTLQKELDESKRGFSAASDILRIATRNLTGVQADHTKNEDRFNLAKSEFDANPTDPDKKVALDRATEEKLRSSDRLKTYQERNDFATRERDAAKERNDVLADEQAGLPTKIQQAKDQLENAQSAVSRQRRAAFLAAQAESEAFVLARDNRPFLFAPAIASTRDPVHRVLMYAFSDSKTIFLRGNPNDVETVKDIIAKFDRPAPQARLTLWTMEMSSDTSAKGTKNFNRALILIEEELANNRALTSAAISFLRHCLNEEVNGVAASFAREHGANPQFRELPRAEQFALARLQFYSAEVLTRLGFDNDLTNANKLREQLRFARLVIPDPAGTTTLGETLMVLCLGTRTARGTVINRFRTELKAQLLKLGLTDSTAANEPSWKTDSVVFASTARVLGLDMDSKSSDPFTPAQEEIVRALERILIQRATAEVRSASDQLHVIELQKSEIEKQTMEASVNDDQKKQLDLRLIQLEARRRNIVRAAIPLINLVREKFGIGRYVPLTLSDQKKEVDRARQELRGFGASRTEIDPRRNDNARIAAADQMLKEMIIAVEDDIERHFVQRMLNSLREKITRENIGVGVGVMQRTSMLATNRLLARVDPRASAQLAVGEEQNILQSVQQLAQIYLSTQAAGPLGLLGALNRQPSEAPPEIYGINTGNTFQVTPIFDPSGQALRFKFDFVGMTRVQEPNGTVSRQLPRIERHTVNTEVQLSNLEIREISRFEANSRIGRPTEYSGGLPIVRDIPKARPYLPLLGWFVRKGGKAAVVQQSLIFGQTTMYPTIQDIMDLLTSPVTAQ
ncbi:MAG TPA: hypothetical protein VL866_06840 [Pyrinomonadaceae bacterium]|nr:hypothetical protein [Pyrinomonadaceae bacterium]